MDGRLPDTWVYDAWGNEVNRTGSTLIHMGYVGELGYYLDPETGMIWVRERPLQPAIARWTGRDPIWPGDGINPFTYGANSPVLIVDPSGLFCLVCRWRRFGDGNHTFASLDANFANGLTPVQNMGQSVFPTIFTPQIKPWFGNAQPATAVELITDFNTLGGLGCIPAARQWGIARHPIVLTADVCFDNLADCVVSAQERRRDPRFNFRTNRWKPWTQRGDWGTGFPPTTPTPADVSPERHRIVRIAKLTNPPVPQCEWRIVIYDEPTVQLKLSANDALSDASHKEVDRKITISDGTNSYSNTDRFQLGWYGDDNRGFTSGYVYTPGVSNAEGRNPPCC